MMTKHENEDEQSKQFDFMKFDDEFGALEWEQMEKELDRAWYDADEEGNVKFGMGEDMYQDFLEGPTSDEKAQSVEEMRQKKIKSQPVSRRTLNSADTDKWELNRMVTSGTVKVTDNAFKD